MNMSASGLLTGNGGKGVDAVDMVWLVFASSKLKLSVRGLPELSDSAICERNNNRVSARRQQLGCQR